MVDGWGFLIWGFPEETNDIPGGKGADREMSAYIIINDSSIYDF